MTDSAAPRLGRDVFIALAAIGWADGQLDQDEADAIVRTATEEGHDLEAVAAIEEATKHPVGLVSLDLSNLTKEDRLFVYAVASWLVRLDGKQTPEELSTLDRLGELLKIPAKPREHADALAVEVAQLPEGDRPARYDLSRLRVIISERLREAQRLRAEAAAAAAPEAAEAPPAEAAASATEAAPSGEPPPTEPAPAEPAAADPEPSS
jgi:hypothetical protein